MSEMQGREVQRRRVVLPALFFVLGLSTVFLFLGFTASAFGRFFLSNQDWFVTIFGDGYKTVIEAMSTGGTLNIGWHAAPGGPRGRANCPGETAPADTREIARRPLRPCEKCIGGSCSTSATTSIAWTTPATWPTAGRSAPDRSNQAARRWSAIGLKAAACENLLKKPADLFH